MCTFCVANVSVLSVLFYTFQVLDRHLGSLKGEVVSEAYARVGLLGNPSDGFGGKTLAFTVDNFKVSQG